MRPIYKFVSEDTGLITKTVSGFIPETVVIPLKKSSQDEIEILVKAGDTVKEGQVIAKSQDTCIHSSIPGTVINIVYSKFADGNEGYAAKIRLEGVFSFTGKKIIEKEWKSKEPSAIVFLMKEGGVLNTFSSPEPLNAKIKNLDKTKDRFLVVRLYSEDPSRITDSFVTEHYFEKIKTGVAITAKAMEAKGILFAFDSNKSIPQNFADSFETETAVVSIDAKKYPNGFMHEIVSAAKKTLKNSIFKNVGNRDLFIDSVTALNVYNAVVLEKPEITAEIQVTGDCLNAGAVISVKTGTSLRQLAEQAGGFKREPGKIIINGKITGNSVSDIDIPISKDIKSVAFIPFRQLYNQTEQSCILCGNCLSCCPVGLSPETLYRCFKNRDHNNSELQLIEKTAILCTECSLCNSVCPSRIPLSQTIALLKKGKINEK